MPFGLPALSEQDHATIAVWLAHGAPGPDAEEQRARLEDQLSAMRRAESDGNFAELAALAHWLKGSGGTAGFDDFTDPARELELLAKSQNADRVPAAIEHLERLAARVFIPSPMTS